MYYYIDSYTYTAVVHKKKRELYSHNFEMHIIFCFSWYIIAESFQYSLVCWSFLIDWCIMSLIMVFFSLKIYGWWCSNVFYCSLRDLHQKCTKEMDDYVGCMYYHTNEFDLCRKEQQAFEQKCSLEWN